MVKVHYLGTLSSLLLHLQEVHDYTDIKALFTKKKKNKETHTHIHTHIYVCIKLLTGPDSLNLFSKEVLEPAG